MSDYVTGYQSKCNPPGSCEIQGQGGGAGGGGGPDPDNGVIESGEECDDHNFYLGDGCGQEGQIEEGWTCSGEPSVCTEIPLPEPESPPASNEPIINPPQNRYNPNYQLIGSSGGGSGGNNYGSCSPLSCEEITACVVNTGSVFSILNLYITGTQQVSCICTDGSTQVFTADCSSSISNIKLSPLPQSSSQNPPTFFSGGYPGSFIGLSGIEKGLVIFDKGTGDYVASVIKKGDLLDIEFFQLKDLKSLDNTPEYCYNGKLDSDEEGTDCGGSCKPCINFLFSPKQVYNYNIWWAIFLILIAVYLQVSKNKNWKQLILIEK